MSLNALKLLLKWGLFLAVVFFVGKALLEQLAALDWSLVAFHVPLAGAAVLCLIGAEMARFWVYRRLLAGVLTPPPWPMMLAVAWIPPLGKYLPGRVAALAGTVWLMRRCQIPGGVAVSVLVLMDGLAALLGLMLAAPLLLWAPVREAIPLGWLWGLILIAAGGVLLHPRVFVAGTNLVLRRLGAHPLPAVPNLKQYLLPLIVTFIRWVVQGMSLWLMAAAVADVAPGQMPLLVAATALAMTGGYLAIFAPGGLGVREAIFWIILDPVIGRELAAVVVVAMRLMQTLVELLLAGIGWMGLRRWCRTEPASPMAPSGSPLRDEPAGPIS